MLLKKAYPVLVIYVVLILPWFEAVEFIFAANKEMRVLDVVVLTTLNRPACC